MSFAFNAILIVVLIFPGILFKYYFRKGFWEVPISSESISEKAIGGIFFSILIHFLLGLILHNVSSRTFGVQIDYEKVFLLVKGDINPSFSDFHLISNGITDSLFLIVIYITVSNFFGIVLGLLSHWFIRFFHLDHKFKFIRFSNEWYYLFWGETIHFSEYKGYKTTLRKKIKKKEIKFAGTYISSLVKVGENLVLYHGLIKEFNFDSKGVLDKIFLFGVRRKFILTPSSNISEMPNKWVNIEGDTLQIKYSEIITLNIVNVFEDERNKKYYNADFREMNLPSSE